MFDLSDDGRDLVMGRVDGVTMLDDLGDHPWRLRRHAHTLADLHTRLGADMSAAEVEAMRSFVARDT